MPLAVETMRPDPVLASLDYLMRCARFLISALRGEREQIPELLTANVLAAARRDCQYAGLLATFYAMLDDKDLALQWLGIAVSRASSS